MTRKSKGQHEGLTVLNKWNNYIIKYKNLCGLCYTSFFFVVIVTNLHSLNKQQFAY